MPDGVLSAFFLFILSHLYYFNFLIVELNFQVTDKYEYDSEECNLECYNLFCCGIGSCNQMLFIIVNSYCNIKIIQKLSHMFYLVVYVSLKKVSLLASF